MNASNHQDHVVDPRGLRRTAAAVKQSWTSEPGYLVATPCALFYGPDPAMDCRTASTLGQATIPSGPRFRNFTPAPAPVCTGTVPVSDDRGYPPPRASHTREAVSDPTPFRRTPGHYHLYRGARLVYPPLFLPARGSPRRV
ncbi:hypothetical protein S40285_10298 [Stachybotrys chlorohalonatus IBT 40285]|uniref:Uncharacterized protein n=1 Tax=Stachybotrys chlorohalonatus (strain IBT 40285) TaxID=1283841 RepID=A0A084QS38_STAC4|nr:hypothetical protein S40285_10298 [Stachybotrys chlorohalonata IBT 40285]